MTILAKTNTFFLVTLSTGDFPVPATVEMIVIVVVIAMTGVPRVSGVEVHLWQRIAHMFETT